MKSRQRWTFSAEMKARIALEAIKEQSKSIEANRKASAKLFDSTRKSVVPEQK